ncbi:hypothetical protein K503DRAFT_549037 [Rhizopogon vinicolor AM-OR11-026]|uniref:Uncharacterized protein n=1 Tax=Rhizopogon vinicolor AM-OR11-026 TaxID=1314800 RepID=A0A1B7MKN8_9AGAM|nr:hypothetical protein K503DRAFT_549037 [Rhizopogon vinicolor AM-OR11-026]
MLSFARITLALTLISSVLGAAIPISTVTTSCTTTATATETLEHYPRDSATGALWRNNVHVKINSFDSSAATPTTEGGRATVRRSGELWRGREHEEVDPIVVTSTGPALPRRSGELWRGLEHEEITQASSAALPRRSGELWRGLEHEEVSGSAI